MRFFLDGMAAAGKNRIAGRLQPVHQRGMGVDQAAKRPGPSVSGL